MITEMGLALALALLFAFLPIRRWMLIPASLPIYFFAYRRGGRPGMLCGLLFSLLTLPRAFIDLPHPVVLLENPLEYLIVGLAGFFPMTKLSNPQNRELREELKNHGLGAAWKTLPALFWAWVYDCRGILLTCVLRFLTVVLGSMVFYAYYYHLAYPAALGMAFVLEIRIFLPGLLFFMLALPFLLRLPIPLYGTGMVNSKENLPDAEKNSHPD